MFSPDIALWQPELISGSIPAMFKAHWAFRSNVVATREHIAKLKDAIWRTHHTDAVHFNTEPVSQTLDSGIVWKGEVEVFGLVHHPRCKVCFAWTYQDNNDEHFAAVLAVPPVLTAADAVRNFTSRSPAS